MVLENFVYYQIKTYKIEHFTIVSPLILPHKHNLVKAVAFLRFVSIGRERVQTTRIMNSWENSGILKLFIVLSGFKCRDEC